MPETRYLEVLCEEPSAEATLRVLLPKLLQGSGIHFDMFRFRGKQDLLSKLPSRLAGYSRWLPQDHKILVLVDRDREDCRELKRRLGEVVENANLSVHSLDGPIDGQVVLRIVEEELESWFLGDPEAVRTAFPRLPVQYGNRAKFRDPDAIHGASEFLERSLQPKYFRQGYRKIDGARTIAPHLDPARNRSKSFQVFRDTISSLAGQEIGPTSGR